MKKYYGLEELAGKCYKTMSDKRSSVYIVEALSSFFFLIEKHLMEGCQNVNSGCLRVAGPRITMDLCSAFCKKLFALSKLFSIITFKGVLFLFF